MEEENLRCRCATTAPHEIQTHCKIISFLPLSISTVLSIQNSTAFKQPTVILAARSLSIAAQKLSNVFNAARKSLTKTHHQNSTALKRPTARLTAHNLSAAACSHTQFHILTAHPTEACRHPARKPRPVHYLRASRRAVCFFIHTTA